MASNSKQEGGAKAAEEEQLNIPSFVRITNTSGFVIPASILNRAWIALSRQIANRAQEAVKTVDHNFLVYFWSEVTNTAPLSPVTADTMISYADTVYDANIGHHFATCIIPEPFWTKTGYRATRLEKKFGEEEGYIDLRIWVEVSYSYAKTRIPFTNKHRVLTMKACLRVTDSRLRISPPFHTSTLALHSAKLYGARTFFTRE